MWTKFKQSSLLSGSAVYICANILNALVPFALLPILTRHLQPEEYGEVTMFYILVSGLTGLVGLSVAGAAGRKYYDPKNTNQELRDFVTACLQILSASTILALALLLAFGGILSPLLGLKTSWMFWALFVAVANIVVQLRLTQWQVRKQAVRYGALQFGQSALNFLLSLVLVVVMVFGAPGRISAQIVTAAMFALLGIYLLYRDGLLGSWRRRPKYIAEVLRFGVPLIPHVTGSFLLLYLDRIVINKDLGLAAAGTYMVAFQFAAAAMLVFSAINNAYVPWLFERLKRDNYAEKLQIVRYTYLWFAIILFGAGMAFFLAPKLLIWIAGDEYSGAGEVVGWLVLGQVFGGMYLMVTNYIFYSKRTGALSAVTISAGIANFALLTTLVPLFGIRGAGIAFASAMGIRFLLTWAVAQNHHPMPWFHFNRAN